MPRETRAITDLSADLQKKLLAEKRRSEAKDRIVSLVQANPNAPVTRAQLADILKFLGVLDA